MDTKKKELVGPFANKGTEYQPAGEPERASTHEFVDPELGRAIAYGIYDTVNDEGWVSVGDTADTAEFAVASIRRVVATDGLGAPPGCSSPPMPAGPRARRRRSDQASDASPSQSRSWR